MKIFLLNPPTSVSLNKYWERFYIRSGSRWPTSLVKRKDRLCDYRPYPFFLSYTASLLKVYNFEIYCYDANNLNHSIFDVLYRINREKPDILLFEAFIHTLLFDEEMIKTLKKHFPNLKICVCGPGARHHLDNPQVEAIFEGEYELSFFYYCINGRIKSIPIERLNDLPMPAYNSWPETDKGNPRFYWDGFCQLKPAVQMMTSRGCPFRCNFCLWNQVMYNKGPYRTLSVPRIKTEIEHLIENYPFKELYFDDDSFTVNKYHVLDVCRVLKPLNIKWSAMADFITADEEMLYTMINSGCIGLKFGVESANPALLKKMGKPLNLDKVRTLSYLCNKLNIRTHATFTFGQIGETVSTMKETLKFAQDLPIDTVQFSITLPYPGTRMYQELKERDMLTDISPYSFDLHSYNVVKFNNLSNKDLKDFFEKAPKRWLITKIKRPSWLYRQLKYFLRGFILGGIKSIRDDIVKGICTLFK